MTRAGSAAASVRLTFGRLVAYSTNQLPLNMAALPVVLNVSHFYGEVLKVPLGIMGLIFIAARVIDAIQDPVIGLISDKFTHRGPRGRLTFVALSLPLLIGGFYMLFHPPEALFVQSTLLAIWLFVALFIVHLGYAGVSISYHAHGAELSDDYNERTRITVGREVFGLLGMTLAVVLPTIFTARFGDHQGYVYMGLAFIPIALAFALPTLVWSPPSVHPPVVREHPEIHVRYFRDWLVSLAPALARPTRNMEKSTSLKALVPFFAPMKNRLFRRLLLVFIINGSALGVAVSVMLFYVEHVLKGNKLQAGIILLVYFGAAALSVPMWLMLSRRYTKTVAWFIAMVMTVAAMSLAVFLGAGDFALFVPIAVITGMGIGADYGLPPSVLADIINAPEGKDTQGDTGAYFGLWALSTKLATAIGAAGSLPVAALLGFNPSRGQYSSTALIFVYIALPVAIKIAAALLIWFIRIEAERGSVRDELLKRA
ncbi:MAG: MFS transporter [Rhodospirillales bacterium]|nr:MFS transporter [Rhodospirillales bacterium]